MNSPFMPNHVTVPALTPFSSGFGRSAAPNSRPDLAGKHIHTVSENRLTSGGQHNNNTHWIAEHEYMCRPSVCFQKETSPKLHLC